MSVDVELVKAFLKPEAFALLERVQVPETKRLLWKYGSNWAFVYMWISKDSRWQRVLGNANTPQFYLSTPTVWKFTYITKEEFFAELL